MNFQINNCFVSKNAHSRKHIVKTYKSSKDSAGQTRVAHWDKAGIAFSLWTSSLVCFLKNYTTDIFVQATYGIGVYTCERRRAMRSSKVCPFKIWHSLWPQDSSFLCPYWCLLAESFPGLPFLGTPEQPTVNELVLSRQIQMKMSAACGTALKRILRTNPRSRRDVGHEWAWRHTCVFHLLTQTVKTMMSIIRRTTTTSAAFPWG